MTTTSELELGRYSRAWLLETGHAALDRSGGSLRDALRALLGVAICERALCGPACAYPSGDLRLLASSVRQRLAADQQRGIFQPLDYDPKLLLLCGHALSASSTPSTVLDDYARALAGALRHCPSAQVAGHLAGERLLLAFLGYLDAPARPAAWSGTISFDHVVTTGLPQIRAVCGQIAASTACGTASVRMPPQARAALHAALPVVMLHTLRQYDLVTGALMLRSLNYLSARRSRSIRCAISFLQAQQQPDGRFGYLAMEASRVEAALGLDPEVELYLPVTVSCLWALAEVLDAGFRLFRPA